MEGSPGTGFKFFLSFFFFVGVVERRGGENGARVRRGLDGGVGGVGGVGRIFSSVQRVRVGGVFVRNEIPVEFQRGRLQPADAAAAGRRRRHRRHRRRAQGRTDGSAAHRRRKLFRAAGRLFRSHQQRYFILMSFHLTNGAN